MSLIRRATRTQQRLRLALCGVSGSGKSYTALRMGAALLEDGQRMLVLDSEHGSASLYAGDENPDGGHFDFDVIPLDELPGQFSPDNYIRCLREGAKEGYPVVVVDSLTHAWAGPGGVLEYVDTVAQSKKKGNRFAAWSEGTEAQNRLVNALLSYPGHVIVTMRSKTTYVQDGKTVRKVGLNPVQRDGIEYEFTVTADIDESHKLVVTKTRCSVLADRYFAKAGKDVVDILKAWMSKGDAPAPRPQPAQKREAFDLPAAAGVPPEVALSVCVAKGWGDYSEWTEAQQRRCAAEQDFPQLAAAMAKDIVDRFHARIPPQPRLKDFDGDKAAWESAKEVWADHKRLVLKAWYGVESATELTVLHAAGPHGLAWLEPKNSSTVRNAWDEVVASA